jgi:hypothetical protein
MCSGSQLGRTTPGRAVLLRGLFLGLIIALIPTGSAQDVNDQGEEDLDDLLGGFDDAPVVKLEHPESPISKGWDVDGFMRTDMSYSIAKGSPSPGAPDYRGFSRLQTTLRLELPVTISENWRAFVSGQAFHDFSYGLKDRANFTKALLDLYEDEAEIRDVYIGGSLWPWIDVKIGRQIIVWGAADYLRVVDVLNPLDNRQPGLVDIEDLRLPITMSRLDISVNNRWTLTGVAVHEVEFGNNPVFNGQFFPFAGAPPSETLPSRSLASTEFAVSLNGSLPGMDVGLFWADYYDDTAHFETRGGDLGLYHSRLSMMGASVNGVLGDWLWKAETALVSGLEFNNSPSDSRSRLDGLVGFEYSGIRDTTLSLEVVNRHLLNYLPVLKAAPDLTDENFTQYTFSARSSFFRDRLHLEVLSSFFGAGFEQGSFQRLSAAYDWWEGFTVTGGILLFQGGEQGSLIDAFDDNDLLFMQAKYSF